MSSLLVPFNNAMRLGQGFNSYTQQICVDDAVIIDPERAENVVTNDGTTMRMLVQTLNKPSVWRQMKEYIVSGDETHISSEPVEMAVQQGEQDVGTAEEAQATDETKGALESTSTDATEDKPSTSKTPASAHDDKDASEPKPATDESIAAVEGETKDLKADLDKQGKDYMANVVKEGKKKAAEHMKNTVKSDQAVAAQKQAQDKRVSELQAITHEDLQATTGMAKERPTVETWSIEQAMGESQIVTYTSHFVDKISEVNEDMRLSGALGIKFGSFGASGRGSFVDTDEFLKADLRFYISVKVINQSLNFKDALQYNPIRSVPESDKEAFAKTFGDSFISGFVEGGELNAVVLMKVLNDAKKQDIQAEVKVAFTTQGSSSGEKKEGAAKEPAKEPLGSSAEKDVAGPPPTSPAKTDTKPAAEKTDSKGIKVDVEGNLKLAKQNISMNTETTIYVSWSGGAAIKEFDEKWTIDSLLDAASRFPALVSRFPQRTYAILTRYNTLRSYLRLKPPSFTPITYENAKMHTNTLLDAFMEYKALYKRLANDILEVQKEVKVFKTEATLEGVTKPQYSAAMRAVMTLGNIPEGFPKSLEGLSQARQCVRLQMNEIVREVDEIAKDPSVAMREGGAKWMGPASFQMLVPPIEFKVRKVRGAPFSNQRINEAITDSSQIVTASDDNHVEHLFDPLMSTTPLSKSEELKVADLEKLTPTLADNTRVSAPVGNELDGKEFCALDFNLREPVISEIRVKTCDDILYNISVTYLLGLTVSYGEDEDVVRSHHGISSKFREHKLLELGLSENITSASIEVDVGESLGSEDDIESQNRLRVVGFAASTNHGRKLDALRKEKKGNEITDHYRIHQFEKPICDGFVSGLWGRSTSHGICRLGLIWTQAPPRDSLFDEDYPITCSTGQLTKTTEKVAFNPALPGKPQLIYGLDSIIGQFPNELSVVGLDNTGFVSAGSKDTERWKSNTDKEKAIDLDKLIDASSPLNFALNWMVVPELEAVQIQSGREEFVFSADDDAHKTILVEFDEPFKSDAKVNVVCWLIDFTPAEDSERFHVKTGVEGVVYPTKFQLKVGDGQSFTKPPGSNTAEIKTPDNTKKDEKDMTEAEKEAKKAKDAEEAKEAEYKASLPPRVTESNTPSRLQRATIGWLAYNTTIGKAKFAAGTYATTFDAKRTKYMWEAPWGDASASKDKATKFEEKPLHHFVALNELGGEMSAIKDKKQISVASVSKSTTAERISLLATAPGNTTLGLTFISTL